MLIKEIGQIHKNYLKQIEILNEIIRSIIYNKCETGNEDDKTLLLNHLHNTPFENIDACLKDVIENSEIKKPGKNYRVNRTLRISLNNQLYNNSLTLRR